MSPIEALYIFDEHNNLLLDHIYTGSPPQPSILLPLYLQRPSPRPSCLYLSSLSPPTVLYSVIQDNLLFLCPTSADTDPLVILEYIHRVIDAFEEFLGAPLFANKITGSYDVVAQILAEIADAGTVCQGDANALRDTVETGPGVLKNLLGTIGATGASPALQPGGVNAHRPQFQPAQSAQVSATPWRRSNVRHTSNELYVDVVESLAITVAPSGRPLSAFAHGSIAFTSKVSGVPELALSLATASGKGVHVLRAMQRVVFHPCVRLSKWEMDGVMTFVPPDGRFALCGYEVDLIAHTEPSVSAKTLAGGALDIPAAIEITTGLGETGSEFEVRVLQPSSSGMSAARSSLQSNLGRSSAFKAGPGGDSRAPAIEGLTVNVPIPSSVRNVPDLRPSRGEAQWSPADGCVEWKIPAREFGPLGAVLRCTVQGQTSDADAPNGGAVMNGTTATTYDYDDDSPPSAYQSQRSDHTESSGAKVSALSEDKGKDLMPSSATLSFSVKGWLASGLKVDSLLVDTSRSKGLGADVRPYKGVKYLTTSRRGIEARC